MHSVFMDSDGELYSSKMGNCAYCIGQFFENTVDNVQRYMYNNAQGR